MDWRVKRVIEVMHERFLDKVSEPALSGIVNLSPARLRQLFKKEVGVSPMQYAKRVRMTRAVNLLQTSFLSIKEVIFKSGWRDGSHFMREFKKQYGLTPGEFRTRSRGLLKRSRRGRGAAE